jgi:uncharacterized membrane protein
MLLILDKMEEEGLLELEDAVVATRAQGANVEIHQGRSKTGKFALRGGGVGLLAGFLVGGPIGAFVAGTATGAIGALVGTLKDYGIDDHFVDELSEALGPESSALFLLGKATDPDEFLKRLKPYKARVLQTNLSAEQERRLQDALAEEEYG